MIAVHGGQLEMRDARSGTSRTVRLRSFDIGRAPVTEGEFRAVGEAVAVGADTSAVRPDVPRHPVTWFDAVRWCNSASVAVGLAPAYALQDRTVTWDVAADGYRLPTQAEWEWACRAGTDGPTYGPLAEIAWTAADGVEGPQPVGGKSPNALGVRGPLPMGWTPLRQTTTDEAPGV